jgi:hypothetical protein
MKFVGKCFKSNQETWSQIRDLFLSKNFLNLSCFIIASWCFLSRSRSPYPFLEHDKILLNFSPLALIGLREVLEKE